MADLNLLVEMGVADDADVLFITRDLDNGFVCAREAGRLRARAYRAGVPGAFDLLAAC